VGPVPRARTSLTLRDHLGTVRARIGFARNQYSITPGLYCTNNPTPESPVFVTANYKLSFDSLRSELGDIDAWILVADTRGINVWCSAGKKTFSDDEISFQVTKARLAEIVSHRELILPQLAAPGVAVHKLQKKCGFRGTYGPILAADIPKFLQNNRQVDESMRAVTFTIGERLVLVPVEIALVWKVFVLVVLGLFILSGFGPDIFSLQAALDRGLTAAAATVLAILAGAMLTPVLLPWIPGRQFWLKGVLAGGAAGIAYLLLLPGSTGIISATALWLWITAAASYMAMNFTGATPFTSLSGVKHEMRRGLALQCSASGIALILWLTAPFIGA
jgi:hypothetical protein